MYGHKATLSTSCYWIDLTCDIVSETAKYIVYVKIDGGCIDLQKYSLENSHLF